ncbi:unnamed protein product [Amoebophrya sp. A25]|nr:unnamed protein product [Amoebophrya sp. A25]|eukprot:GSA25T00014100001.1
MPGSYLQGSFHTGGVVSPAIDLETFSRLLAKLHGGTQQVRAELERASWHLDKAEAAGTMIRAVASKHRGFLPPFTDMRGRLGDRQRGFSHGYWPSKANYDSLFL